MDKCLYNGVDIFNPLQGKMKYFIDAFTQVYGEQYRPVIESRLKSAKYFFLGGNFSDLIKKYKKRQDEEIKKLDTHNIPVSLKVVKAKEITERYSIIINVFQNCLNKQNNINKKYSLAQNNLLNKQIQYIRNCKNLANLTQQELQGLDKIYMDLLVQGKKNFLDNVKLFTQQQKDNYTLLFSKLGYNLNNFEECAKNNRLLNEVFNPYLIEILNNLNKLRNDELNKTNIFTTDFESQFKKLEVYGDKTNYLKIANEYIQGKSGNAAYVVNCLSYKYGYTNLCFCNNALSLTIEDLTHEMGHIIDSFVVESDKKGYYYKLGFEVFYFGYSNESYLQSGLPNVNSKQYRQNMLFNEMVNEYITLQVANKIKENNIKLAFDSRDKKYINSYQFGFEIFNDFLKKYQNQLIKLKLEKDKNDKTLEYFGEKNFNMLAELAKNYIKKRIELNHKLLKGQNVKDEIEEYKSQGRKKLEFIEKRIEKHIAKQSINDNKKSIFSEIELQKA